MNPPRKFFDRLARKAGAAALILALGLAAGGTWLFLRDQADFDARRAAQIATLTAARTQLETGLADDRAKLAALQTAAQTAQQRAAQAAAVVATLRDLNGWWTRAFGDRAQARADAERIAQVEQLRAAADQKSAELTLEAKRAQWMADGAEIALAENARALQTAGADRSRAAHYLAAAWGKSRGWIIAALAGYFFGMALLKLVLYFGFAPLVARGKPIRLAPTLEAVPRLEENGAAGEIALWPGEALWLRRKFSPVSTEGLRRKTRWTLNGRFPFACLACGWAGPVEWRNAQAGGERPVAIASRRDPVAPLAAVSVPENASFVMRPGLLAGVIQSGGKRPVIRRHWRLFHRSSWVAGQFRHFELAGPCRLLLATGGEARRIEPAGGRGDGLNPARRASLRALIGFTPNLAWRATRTESFRAYWRGRSPLFEGRFEGPGLVIVANPAPAETGRTARRFLARGWRGMLKLGGL